MNEEKKYGMLDVWGGASEIEPGPEHIQRRRIAKAMRQVMDRLILLDAYVEELEEYANELEGFLDRISCHEQLDQNELMTRVVSMEASREDALNTNDYEIYVGESTPINLPMELWQEGDVIRGKGIAGVRYQGPPGRVHGGIIAGIFDVLLARTQGLVKAWGYTGTLKIKYLAATPLDTEFEMEARVVGVEGKKLFNEGKIIVDGEVTAIAEGIWISAAGDFPVPEKN